MATTPIIEVHDLCCRLGHRMVLDGLNLAVMPGEMLVIVGRSGTGKSVFLKHLIGLMRPTSGRVLVDGEDLHQAHWRQLARLRERFGMLFQGGALFDSLTVAENVAFPLREKTRLSEAEITKIVDEVLRDVGLVGVGQRLPDQLSGGMRKRVALARALAHRPEIILFDEPTTGLDPILVRAIHQLIAETQAHFGYTAVVVSHELPRVFDIASRVAMLHDGVLIEVAPPEQFQNSPNPVVQQFIAGRLEGPLTTM